jgi:hypothetical protein
MKKFIGFAVFSLLASLGVGAAPAMADVQNVKISGDIDAKAIWHENYDLKKEDNTESETNATVTRFQDDEGFALSTVRVRIDADLTDNVSTAVRLLNQRKWGADDADTGDIEINLANVTLNELLYSPLTVTVGRQDLQYGRGFIVGSGLLLDPNGVFTQASTGYLSGVQDGSEDPGLMTGFRPLDHLDKSTARSFHLSQYARSWTWIRSLWMGSLPRTSRRGLPKMISRRGVSTALTGSKMR